SARLLLPEPLGPTTALIPPPNSTSVRSANDLNPWRRSARRRAGGLSGASPGGPVDVGTGGRIGRRRSRRPDRLERLERGRSLRGPPGRPLPDPERPAVDPDLDPEELLVVRAAGVEDAVVGPGSGPSLGVLLEAALGALQQEARRVVRELRLGERRQPGLRRVPAQVEVDRPGQRLEPRGEQRRPAATAPLGPALAQDQRRPQVAP